MSWVKSKATISQQNIRVTIYYCWLAAEMRLWYEQLRSKIGIVTSACTQHFYNKEVYEDGDSTAKRSGFHESRQLVSTMNEHDNDDTMNTNY